MGPDTPMVKLKPKSVPFVFPNLILGKFLCANLRPLHQMDLLSYVFSSQEEKNHILRSFPYA